jgi:hypothetical protein
VRPRARRVGARVRVLRPARPKGNRESFVWLAEAGRSGDVGDDLDAAARAVEP